MRFWTVYWRRDTVEGMMPLRGPCEHTAGNRFVSSGVRPGDRVFVTSFFDGELHLIGAMTVEQIVDQKTANRRYSGTNLWKARDHLIALSPKHRTRRRADRVLSKAQLRRIPYVTYRPDGRVEPQVFRYQPRKISSGTAALFERVLAAQP
jgi:hypothetical protein